MKILLFGASGSLGRELLKLNSSIIAPSSDECNINTGWIMDYIGKVNPDIIIHAAAITDNRKVEKNPEYAIRTNIIGTAHIAMACLKSNIRLVYLSTDYIYDGSHGNYKETDPIQPFNLYSWTKLGGECSVKAVANHLIIRTSFGANEFPYKEAFTDKWSSKDYVDRIAPLIYEAALSPITGLLNLGTERKTLYDHASERKTVKPVKIADTNYFTPYDTSLNLQKWQDYKNNTPIAKPHTKCRICGSSKLTKYLDLGLQPLVNNIEQTAVSAKNKERFPLQVMVCEQCGLSQLSVIIDPEKMFSNYAYRSSVNKPYTEHCKQMAYSLQHEFNLSSETFHIDIAGNDGALLMAFKEILHHEVLNVDPAQNLTAIAEANGIESITDFWSFELAQSLDRKADLITATNIFAHLDNVKEFIEACKLVLNEKGILVIEAPYLIDFIENMEFDTVYFEHLSYLSLSPIVRLCNNLGMEVISVERQKIHGGSMRYIIGHKGVHFVSPEVDRTIEIEKAYSDIDLYTGWQEKVSQTISNFQTQLLELKRSGKKIVAFGASAKGATLLNAAKMNTDIIDYIIDETPEKINKFQPGTGIPIVNKHILMKDHPDYILILAWNFADVIMAKLTEMGYAGKFIIPIPEFKVI